MTEKQLLVELDNVNALREKRLYLTSLILNDLSNIKPLIRIAFKFDNEISIKAAWVLEFVIKQKLEIVLPHLNYFSKNLQKIHFGGAVRSMAKITQLITQNNNKNKILTNKQEKAFIEIAFDWLISEHKVAIKSYSMQVLFLLGKKHDWIHVELKNILLENIHKYSSAYKARARITIKQIDKFNDSKIIS